MALIDNKKALFSYEVSEKFEAGIELFGHEVKAVRNGMGSLAGSYVLIRGGEAFLTGATISPYQQGNVEKNYDPGRVRRLLLSKGELGRLSGATTKEGLTLIPISMYNKGSRIKLEIALARGKKLRDKRATIQKRETDRDIERLMKRG